MKKSKRLSVAAMIACLALFGALAIGSTADAKKKSKNATVTASKTVPTTIPARVGDVRSFTAIPLSIGGKAKGKIVDASGPELTYGLSGVAGSLDNVSLRLTAPNGRTIGIDNPAGPLDTTVGPFTETANSPVGTCFADPTPPAQPPCFDPENSLVAPYAGIAGNADLGLFAGIGAKGTWILKVQDGNTTQAATLGAVKLSVPTASKFK
jgi:hypothetical protein